MLTTDQKKARAALLIRSKADFKIRKITTDKEEPYIIIQWSSLQKDTIIFNMYAPNSRASKM